MATIVDVAALAQVSTSTVSHVLNGTRAVRPATRKKVLAAIERTGYRQDALARALRRSRTDSVGLVISDPGEPAFAEMVHGVEGAAAKHGLTLVLATSAEDPERELRAVRTLLERRVDGLILARCAASSDALTAILDAEATPIVLIDRVVPDAPFDQVGADNRESMARLVTHLRGQGHRRIALVAGDTRVPTLAERLAGFLDATPAEDRDAVTVLDGERIDARALADAIGSGGVTCVVASSTPLAVTALEAVRDAGLAVPTDLAFATFDGFAHSDLFAPAITTIRQPASEMGAAAIDLLTQRLDGATSAPRTLRLRQSLELRASSETFDFAGRTQRDTKA